MNYDNFTKEQIVSILKDTLEYSSKLREEIERLNTDKEQLNSLVNSCQEEIRRLNKKIEIKNNRIQQLMKRTRSSRIDKAIEHIEEDIKGNYFKRYDDEVYKLCDDLLEILKGSDKE